MKLTLIVLTALLSSTMASSGPKKIHSAVVASNDHKLYYISEG